MKLFLDTNVVLDYATHRHPFWADAEVVIGLIENREAQGYVSAISFTTAHYVARKVAGAGGAMKIVHAMDRLFETVSCDSGVIRQALASGMAEFEDAVQYFSAVAAGAERIITRNVDHFPSDGPIVQTTAEFVAWWKQHARKGRRQE